MIDANTVGIFFAQVRVVVFSTETSRRQLRSAKARSQNKVDLQEYKFKLAILGKEHKA
jgi:hypothetical protein